LGDNIFYGDNLSGILQEAAHELKGAVVFGYYVKDPRRYGVIGFSKDGKVNSLQEKPQDPPSNWAVTGMYFYDSQALKLSRGLKPSARGELEITDLNNEYLKKGRLKVKLLSRGYAWLDTGEPDALIDASMFIKTVEDRQGLKIGCIEEVAYRMGYIDRKQLAKLADGRGIGYQDYLRKILDE
jgi:glucose-1-phosphate thymidylyltransferase